MHKKSQINIFGNIILAISLLLIPFIVSANEATTTENSAPPVWYEVDQSGKSLIHLYFFWSEKCPHCLQALPDIIEIDKTYPWLVLHSLELVNYPENIQTFVDMSNLFGVEARSVPTFMFCGNLMSGYESRQSTGALLESNLQACYEYVREHQPENEVAFKLDAHQSESIELPFLGEVSMVDSSLPVLTVFIAGMDAFNPCAFFVLLFLLSLMAHTQSRRKMLLIGGVFVFISGAMYFLFMAAWLNLFIHLGELRIITLAAGVIAVLVALINIKDYFWFKKGVSLSIPDNKKPELFERMRNLLKLDSTMTVLVSTIVLAIVANSYEMLCTAGFPMVYTRILTLNSLSAESYYLYLLLYNLIYILPLLTIVILFTIKLGSRKLSESEGMILKLVSGVMMLLLGAVLVISPELLSQLSVAGLLVLLAISISWGVVKWAPTEKK